MVGDVGYGGPLSSDRERVRAGCGRISLMGLSDWRAKHNMRDPVRGVFRVTGAPGPRGRAGYPAHRAHRPRRPEPGRDRHDRTVL